MKLNLLPTYVSRGKNLRLAVAVSLVFVLTSVGAAFVMITSSQKDMEVAKEQETDRRQMAQRVVDTAASATQVMAPATLLVRHVGMARAMNSHNNVYPRFYDRLFPYIPSYFRINSLAAAPRDSNTVTVTMTGIIKTEREYADLMLALLRIPGATNVTRSGFSPEYPVVSPLSSSDQVGIVRRPGEPAVRENSMAHLNWLLSQGRVTGYENRGNFGSGNNARRGAMPFYTEITVNVTMPGNLLTPNPRQTLAGSVAAAGAIRPAGGGQ